MAAKKTNKKNSVQGVGGAAARGGYRVGAPYKKNGDKKIKIKNKNKLLCARVRGGIGGGV